MDELVSNTATYNLKKDHNASVCQNPTYLYQMYLDMVKCDGLMLECVPVEFQSDELILTAIHQNKKAIRFVR